MAKEMIQGSRLESGKARKILIVNLGGIGDFLLSTPALRLLKSGTPGACLVFLGVPRVRECVEASGLFHEVVTLDPGKVLDTLRALRAKQFDLAVNMRTIVSWPGALKIYLLFFFIAAKRWAGRNTDGKGFFFHVKVSETLPGVKHEMVYDLDTIAALGVDVSRASLSLEVDQEALQKVAEGLARDGARPGEALVGIHPGGALSHRWPLACYAQAIKMLQEKKGCRVVITGGAGEEGLFEQLRKAGVAGLINRVGSLSFKDSVALISKCRLFVSNDTGPMHIAAILGVPLVAIFGGGYLARFDPRKISSKAVVLQTRASCAPCDREACSSMKCLKNIIPQDVMNAAEHLWEKVV